MKEYNKPELTEEKIELEDIIAASAQCDSVDNDWKNLFGLSE